MTRVHAALAATAATLAGTAAYVDVRSPIDVTHLAAEIEAGYDHISALDLAERIMKDDRTLRLLDLRTAAEFNEFHIPGASVMSISALAKEPLPQDATIALYSEGGAHAAQAWVLLRLRGYRKVVVLREGIYEWVSRVLEPRLANDATSAEKAEYTRASVLSRYFGGIPRSGVARSELAVGYWTGASQSTPDARTTRRRGC
jgi:rhodanese-related sulfurtransferase